MSESEVSTSSLVETLEPATIATIGFSGVCKARPKASSSAARSGPAAATGAKRATPSVEASARCAVPNASITNTSQSAAYFCASSGLFFFSPWLKRQFSKRTT